MQLHARIIYVMLIAKVTILTIVKHSPQVFVIDYGLAKKYRDLQTHKHIPYR
jgi:hypothetical protein